MLIVGLGLSDSVRVDVLEDLLVLGLAHIICERLGYGRFDRVHRSFLYESGWSGWSDVDVFPAWMARQVTGRDKLLG